MPEKTEIVLGTVMGKFTLHRVDIHDMSDIMKELVDEYNKHFHLVDFISINLHAFRDDLGRKRNAPFSYSLHGLIPISSSKKFWRNSCDRLKNQRLSIRLKLL